MQCLSCGTSLLPGMKICPGCGNPASYSTSAPSYPAENNDPTIPAGFGPFIETTPASLGSLSGGIPQQSFSNGAPQGTRPANEGVQAYNAIQPPYTAYPPPPIPPAQTPPPRQRRGPSKGMLILLSILVLVMLAGTGTIYYFSIPYPAQIRAQATATAQSQANTAATATAQVIHNANATATAQAQATLTAQQNIYTQATNGNPAISDALAKNSPLQWNEYDTSSNGGCVFTAGTYHVKEYASGYFQPCFAQAGNFSNFTLQVQMTILSGEYGGIIFRADDQNSKFYLLQIGTNNSYQLFKYTSNNGDNASTLLTSYSSIIKGQNQPNLLTLIARGNQLTLFVNKQYIDTASDNTYKAGMIGLVAYDKSMFSEVAFSYLQMWKL